MHRQLTAVIPTYTNTEGLKKITSFLHSQHIPTIVVDNQPTLEKKALCQKKSLTYLPQQKNNGFACAVNKALEYTKTQWLLVLNDDIEILDDTAFEKLVTCAKTHSYAAVSPVLKKPTGEVENYGYKVLPQGKIQLITNYNQFKLIETNLDYLDGLTAACLLIKTDVFKKYHGFDERFFAYLEDVDLFLRLKKSGERFGICPEIKVIHRHMTTSKQMGYLKQIQDVKNWILLITKHWDTKTLIRYFPTILIERARNVWGLVKTMVTTIQYKDRV